MSLSKYSPWEAMHRCQYIVDPSKQFWNWFCGMAFRAAFLLFLMSSKCLPSNISLFLGTERSHWWLDPVNREGIIFQHPVALEIIHVFLLPSVMQYLCRVLMTLFYV
jgi:hypothetical protein